MTAIDALRQDAWMRQDPRLPNDWPTLSLEWPRDHALRTDYTCRQALVESDVLAARIFDLTLGELLTIYRVQFPFICQYGAVTYYDVTGRMVFPPSKYLPGVGLPRKAVKGDASYTLTTPEGMTADIALSWEDVRDFSDGSATTVSPVGRSSDCPYHAPFGYWSRVTDYITAWNSACK